MKYDELKPTEIYARFAEEVYDDFGDSPQEQEYYRKEHADAAIAELKEKLVEKESETRKQKRALWLARAERAKDRATTCNDFAYLGDTERGINMALARTWMKCRMLKPSEWSKVWNNVERKCLKKAEEYK